jgi:hypothetical protein
MTNIPPPDGSNRELYIEWFYDMVGEPFEHDEHYPMASWILCYIITNNNKIVHR